MNISLIILGVAIVNGFIGGLSLGAILSWIDDDCDGNIGWLWVLTLLGSIVFAFVILNETH